MVRLAGATFVFIGRSGCGKGTQADLLEKYLKEQGYDVVRMELGIFLRARAEKKTLMGEWLRGIMTAGKLAPSWLASAMLVEMIEELLTEKNQVALIDGSPRRLYEAQILDELMADVQRPKVRPIYLDISEEEARRRLAARGRMDDKNKAIENRLAWFTNEVVPVLSYYGNRLITVSGEGDIHTISAKIIKLV